jgi:AcrR family transcriptional regulator
MQNAILPEDDPNPESEDVASRVARASLLGRESEYVGEVRALMTAALAVMGRAAADPSGPGRARVADIVAAAGLSNDAFYRHFRSKDALVTALLEDGTRRLTGGLARRMAAADGPAGAVRGWVEGILAEAGPGIAPITRAVLANGGGAGNGMALGRHFAAGPLAELVAPALAELGTPEPRLAATLAAHAVLGRLADHLWQGTEPDPAEAAAVVRFCLAVTGPAAGPAIDGGPGAVV